MKIGKALISKILLSSLILRNLINYACFYIFVNAKYINNSIFKNSTATY